jgi:hypothetical protein
MIISPTGAARPAVSGNARKKKTAAIPFAGSQRSSSLKTGFSVTCPASSPGRLNSKAPLRLAAGGGRGKLPELDFADSRSSPEVAARFWRGQA